MLALHIFLVIHHARRRFFMKSMPLEGRCFIAVLLLAAIIPSSAGAEGRFFARAGVGPAFPSLENLDNELAVQGNEKVDMDISIGVSLGRTFLEDQWSLEAHFSAAFYPEFDYKAVKEDSVLEDFPGKLSHNNFMLIGRRHWRTEARWLKPSLGAGIGYGITSLISGGGKIGALEALGVFRVESAIRDNINLALEAVYHTGLQKKPFKNAHLENYESDGVYNSAGDWLEDKYDSFDIRLGITIWLKQRWPE